MVWFFVWFVVVLFVYSILSLVAKSLWLTFRWNVLGVPPRIFDQEIVTKTVDDCGKLQADHDIAQMKTRGLVFTAAEEESHLQETKMSMKSLIEEYIDRFTRRH